jgi:cysteine desulfurase
MRFFDHNATTPLLPQAKAAWLEASEHHWLNPSSPYRVGAAAHARLEGARERFAAMLGVDPRRVVFNSGATEGNNAVFAAWAQSLEAGKRVGVGATEHPSVIEAAKQFLNGRIDWLAPESSGLIATAATDWSGLGAVSVMAANNETGILNPWREWAEACRERGLRFHCDASQWIGKMPLDGLGLCDSVTACAHKFGGPKGVGFLLVPDDFRGSLFGGAHEGGRRAGTENLAGVLAMLAALEWVESKRPTCSGEDKARFAEALVQAIPGVEIVGGGLPSLWNTLSVAMPKFKSVRWIRTLEKKGFLVSAGSACSTGSDGPSHVLAAMGLEPTRADRVLRISSGWETEADDWDALLDAIVESYRELEADEATQSGSRVISI